MTRLDGLLFQDAAVAGSVAAVLSGVPSTLHALSTGRSVLEGALAAGSIALPSEDRRIPLLLAAVPVHLGLSLGWALVLAAVLPRRRTVTAGGVAGVAIAALDLGLIGRRYSRIRALPQPPQIADHLAYGITVGAVLRHRRRGALGTGFGSALKVLA